MMSTQIEKQQEKPARRPSTILLYSDIRKEYQRLKSIKKNGVTVYSDDYILNQVANKFYKSPKTVENIVYNRV